MKKFLKVLFYVIAAIYPVLMFTMFVVFKMPVRVLSLCVVVLACAFFLSATGNRKSDADSEKKALDWRPMLSSALFLLAGILCFVFNEKIFLKLYSVVINATLLCVFGSSLIFKPNIIFRFACVGDKSIKDSTYEKNVDSYCKKVTIVWCVFFVANGSISAVTALYNFGNAELNDKIWSIYNGGISYILMGLLFAVEYLVRMQVDKKMVKTYSFTKFKADSRKDDYVLCFEGSWSKKNYKTWKDFLIDSAKIRALTGIKEGAKANNSLSVSIPVGAKRVVIAVPSNRSVTSVKDVNDSSAEIISAFETKTIQVEGAEGYTAVDYKVYICDYANAATAANTYKVTIA